MRRRQKKRSKRSKEMDLEAGKHLPEDMNLIDEEMLFRKARLLVDQAFLRDWEQIYQETGMLDFRLDLANNRIVGDGNIEISFKKDRDKCSAILLFMRKWRINGIEKMIPLPQRGTGSTSITCQVWQYCPECNEYLMPIGDETGSYMELLGRAENISVPDKCYYCGKHISCKSKDKKKEVESIKFRYFIEFTSDTKKEHIVDAWKYLRMGRKSPPRLDYRNFFRDLKWYCMREEGKSVKDIFESTTEDVDIGTIKIAISRFKKRMQKY